MRYDKTHKAQTRQTITAEAARLFRMHGYEGLSIDELMASVGLTRGGFYNHFSSKAALYAAALGEEHEFITRMQARDAKDTTALGTQGAEVASNYLKAEHRDGIITGCSLAALAMETARADAQAQEEYAAAVRTLCAEFERGLPNSKQVDKRALAVIATCVGGLLVSSACRADPALADAISQAANEQVERILTDD